MNKLYTYTFYLLVMALTISCSKFQPLEYKGYSGFQIENEGNNPKISTTVHLYNPNGWSGKLQEMSMDVELGNKKIGSIGLEEPVKMPRRKSFSLPFSMTTSYSILTDAATGNLLDVISGKAVPYNLEGTITLKKFLIFKRTYAVVYADSISLRDLKF